MQHSVQYSMQCSVHSVQQSVQQACARLRNGARSRMQHGSVVCGLHISSVMLPPAVAQGAQQFGGTATVGALAVLLLVY